MSCNHSGSESTWERWQWMGILHSLKLQHYCSLTTRLFSIICRTLVRGGSYPFAEKQLVYSRAPTDWAMHLMVKLQYINVVAIGLSPLFPYALWPGVRSPPGVMINVFDYNIKAKDFVLLRVQIRPHLIWPRQRISAGKIPSPTIKDFVLPESKLSCSLAYVKQSMLLVDEN